MSVREGIESWFSPGIRRAVSRELDKYRDEVLREAAAKIRREVQAFKDDGILEPDKDWTASGAADLIDPDKEG
jgi:hypothetical protein